MIEHLVSQDAMARLLRLTAILSSGDADTVPVLDRYRRTRWVCPNHDVEACDICEDHCLVEMITRELPRTRVATERGR
jgi:hypothetical protein